MLIEVDTGPADGPAENTHGWLSWSSQGKSRRVSCALGRNGIVTDKREGDGATPAGTFVLRRVLYRADRGDPPDTRLQVRELGENDGWCDDPARQEYNRQVPLPFDGSAERLWRDDALYDIVVVLGHNDDPPEAGCGSAVFLHVARDDFAPTEGCIAIARGDLLALLKIAGPGDSIRIGSPQ